MAEILHQVIIKAPPLKVYGALTEQKSLAGWWTRYVHYEPRVGSVAQFELEGGKMKLSLKILKLLPSRAVAWHCLSGPSEWVGTQITFDLLSYEGNTLLNFSHRGWQGTARSLPLYNFEWARYLLSLRSFVEKGKGYPDRK
jgi:uncharacterized protein YndB with AHSA1/START domain